MGAAAEDGKGAPPLSLARCTVVQILLDGARKAKGRWHATQCTEGSTAPYYARTPEKST